jgi:hypothetical protein
MARLDAAEEYNASKCIDQHKKKHADYDKERLEEGDYNCQHEHFESGLVKRRF